MKHTTLIWLMTVSVLLGAGGLLGAQESAKGPTKGKVLLLRSGHVMEGDIEKVGSQLVIRRGKSEVEIPADSCERLCPNWDDAFAYLETLLKPNDANDRVKFARWCHLHQLNTKALEQARIALELQPDHADARQLVTGLERTLREDTKPRPKVAEPIATAPMIEPGPKVDVSSETLIAFTTKIQPILMNTCATCHATGQGGKFHLDRVASASQKASTQRNLARVLTYIDLERPAISPLLVRAVTNHGKAVQPPLKGRDAKAFLTLQDWVNQTIQRNPQLRDYAAERQSLAIQASAGDKSASGTSGFASSGGRVRPRTVPREEPPETKTQPEKPTTKTPIKDALPRELPAAVTQAPMKAIAPAPMPPAMEDAVDPKLFNDHYHPGRR